MLEYNNGRGVPWCSRFQRDCFFFTGGASPSPTDIMGAIIVRIFIIRRGRRPRRPVHTANLSLWNFWGGGTQKLAGAVLQMTAQTSPYRQVFFVSKVFAELFSKSDTASLSRRKLNYFLEKGSENLRKTNFLYQLIVYLVP